MSIRSPEMQKAAKRAQIARLAAKGKPGYAEMFANQPAQIIRAEQLRAERTAERDARNALDIANIIAANAAADVFTQGTGELTTSKGEK